MTAFWWNWSSHAKFLLNTFLINWLKLFWAVSSNLILGSASKGSDDVYWKFSRCPVSMSTLFALCPLFFLFWFVWLWICLEGLPLFHWCAQEAATTACKQPVPLQTAIRYRGQEHISLTSHCVPNLECLVLAQLFILGKIMSVMLCWFAASEDLPGFAATVWSGGMINIYPLEIKPIWQPSQVTQPGLSGVPDWHLAIYELQPWIYICPMGTSSSYRSLF